MKKKSDEGDIVPFNTSEKVLKDEVNSRTAKAGHTTRYGEQRYATKVMTTVPFGKTKLKVWPRDKHGNLIGE
jgi:hypothetical protein